MHSLGMMREREILTKKAGGLLLPGRFVHTIKPIAEVSSPTRLHHVILADAGE
jgi:hypothetical protein